MGWFDGKDVCFHFMSGVVCGQQWCVEWIFPYQILKIGV